jgi:DNA-binding NtrC family response regulator
MARILVVDDDPAHRSHIATLIAGLGHLPVLASGGDEALARLGEEADIAAMVLDLVMPDRDGLGVLDAMARAGRDLPVLVTTGHPTAETLATARHRGAFDYLPKPVVAERLMVALDNALRFAALRRELSAERARRDGAPTLAALETADPVMARVIAQIGKAARSGLPVLLEGEAGSGKSLVAAIVHGESDRAGRILRSIDLASVPHAEMAAMLFGHGGSRGDGGLLRACHGGTLVIEDIGLLPPELQQRLADYLATGNLAPPGMRPERLNTRIVATTGRRLLNLARAGVITADLYNRLNVMPLYLPPLRHRPADILVIARTVLAARAAEHAAAVTGLSPEAETLLLDHDWPGNVGELVRAVCRAVSLCEANRLVPADFPALLRRCAGPDEARRQASGTRLPSAPVHIDDASMPVIADGRRESVADRFLGADGDVASVAAVEKALIAFALDRHAGHMSRVARTLGIGRSTLYRKLREYGLDALAESDAA